MSAERGHSNKNSQPNSKARKRLKLFLLERDGDGETVACGFGCGTMLTLETITLDRFPIMAMDGGTYARANVRGACGPCNSLQGSLEYHRRQGHQIRTTKGLLA